MKILHIVPGLNEPTNGIAIAAKQIAAEQENAECIDFCENFVNKIAESDEVWVHSMWLPRTQKACKEVLKQRKPLIRMPHGCLDPVKMNYRWYKKMWFHSIEKNLFKRSAAIVSTQKEEGDWIRSFVGNDAPIRFVDLNKKDREIIERLSTSTSTSPLTAHTSPYSTLKVLYIGRLHPLKGVEYLIRAMVPCMQLTCVGKDDGELKKLKKLAAKLHANVDFRGIVSEEEKERLYKECDVFCLPTLSENFGLVVAEALERGKSVITTDGAPAWKEYNIPSSTSTSSSTFIYLEGYREGDDYKRVNLLRDAFAQLSPAVNDAVRKADYAAYKRHIMSDSI